MIPWTRALPVIALLAIASTVHPDPASPTPEQLHALFATVETECAQRFPGEASDFYGAAQALEKRIPGLAAALETPAYRALQRQARQSAAQLLGANARRMCDELKHRAGIFSLAGPPPSQPTLDAADDTRPEQYAVRLAFFGDRYVAKVQAADPTGKVLARVSLMQSYYMERYSPTFQTGSAAESVPASIELTWSVEDGVGSGAERMRVQRFDVHSAIPQEVIRESRKYGYLLYLIFLLDDTDAYFAWALEASTSAEPGRTPERRLVQHGGASRLVFCHWKRTWAGAPSPAQAGECP